MRVDNDGNWHTLDEDYTKLWKQHKIEIIKVEFGKENGLETWKIYGKFMKK